MTLEELIREVPELEGYLRFMPEELKLRYTIKTYPPGTIIHQKDEVLTYFGIVCKGYHRVINEFENGNVFDDPGGKGEDFGDNRDVDGVYGSLFFQKGF